MTEQTMPNNALDPHENVDIHLETKIKLKHILGLSKCDHRLEIMKQQNLQQVHAYCKINQLSGQVFGPLIENYIKDTNIGMTKNKASLCIGDLNYKGINYEIKISLGGGKNNKFNFNQLRMNHICDYILTAYYITEANLDSLGELFIFKLNKQDLKYMILNHGGYAHGTGKKNGVITEETLDNALNDKEYAFRPKYGDKCWQDLLQFQIPDISSI